jgi:hypothetical protein
MPLTTNDVDYSKVFCSNSSRDCTNLVRNYLLISVVTLKSINDAVVNTRNRTAL